ncbi:thiamine phosphate synthase [Pararhizobium mangrovi]|uniref:Thiamine phosphate synthase n=1 Tax=Pararhizobium mangrovi TaxID=2590452 RepID=A0A506U1G9_9HYPH|nr:thiamine phosphate synthase [Pararhizobium mangrovi]TPW27590.1 thiamine phosphate synthase [Pararhizobium mangrovi]
MTDVNERCRLVLIAPAIEEPEELARVVADALRGGDVASVILPAYALGPRAFQDAMAVVVPLVQKAGAAAIVVDDSRTAGRVGADGIHLTGDAASLAEAVERFQPSWIVGGGNAKTRHGALDLGEARPDYVFFGTLEGDIKPPAHPRNLDLAEWWAAMVEIPCIVMGGQDPASALEVAQAGADFVALRLAVFSEPESAARIVAEINAMLDSEAPRLSKG